MLVAVRPDASPNPAIETMEERADVSALVICAPTPQEWIKAGNQRQSKPRLDFVRVGITDYWRRAAQAAGVSSGNRCVGVLAKPGSTADRYSRTGIVSRRQVSMMERIAATFGPACGLPTWIQFLRKYCQMLKRGISIAGKTSSR